MEEKKCFCHLNGYEVKDATARNEIAVLNTEKFIIESNLLAVNRQLDNSAIKIENADDVINYLNNNECDADTIFIVEAGDVTFIRVIEPNENAEPFNYATVDFIMGNLHVEPNKNYYIKKNNGDFVYFYTFDIPCKANISTGGSSIEVIEKYKTITIDSGVDDVSYIGWDDRPLCLYITIEIPTVKDIITIPYFSLGTKKVEKGLYNDVGVLCGFVYVYVTHQYESSDFFNLHIMYGGQELTGTITVDIVKF